ncbi:MAG: HAD family hydrolase [Lachnospiraceae bacterium]|nr:HAD family hydrolase [Ruminococcus sp.]MCM1275314.1 HAD family hydrolase [Lachnospiraceae bacterium]
MIKLIASDMDGTLLDDEKRLPPDFFEVLDMLAERGVTFAAASGRTYSALEHLFPEPYRDGIAYICDNGACTVLDGKPADVFPLDRATYEELLDVCGRIGGFRLITCAESGVFHLESDLEFSADVAKFYRRHKVIDDLWNVEGRIYKLAILDERGSLTHGKPVLDGIFGSRLNVQASGEVWMDVMTEGVNKGTALKALQERLGVTRAETMVFGDYFNDVEMLKLADWSFCMENGHEDVKRMCAHIAPDNNHGGVTRCIKQVMSGEIIGVFSV